MGEQSRLLWRCRRGIKEMDLLFQQYLQQCYPGLSETERKQFEALLEETDLDIYDWILDRSQPDNKLYLPLIAQLQSLKAAP